MYYVGWIPRIAIMPILILTIIFDAVTGNRYFATKELKDFIFNY